jgi:hypothetical protein
MAGRSRGLLNKLGRSDGPGPVDPDATTMIVPRGTSIDVDDSGQLSIRTPGNLVLQNSGVFAHLESVNGSIRIEQGVEVEAATVRCAGACYVQGSLTAWKVVARSLHLEDGADAHVVLQETDTLEVGRDARLVGNFASEDEMFVLFSRFARQVRQMPFYRNRPSGGRMSAGGPGNDAHDAPLDEPELVERLVPPVRQEQRAEPAPAPEPVPTEPSPPKPGARTVAPTTVGKDLAEPLGFALSLLAREVDSEDLDETGRRVVEELVKLLAEPDLITLRHTHRTLFAKIDPATEGVQKAEWLVDDYFSTEPEDPLDQTGGGG